jgi:hypothetical protein
MGNVQIRLFFFDGPFELSQISKGKKISYLDRLIEKQRPKRHAKGNQPVPFDIIDRVIQRLNETAAGIRLRAIRHQNQGMPLALEIPGDIVDTQHIAAIFGKREPWGEDADFHDYLRLEEFILQVYMFKSNNIFYLKSSLVKKV